MKFRTALGRAGCSGPQARLAVGVSGGPASAALAYLAVEYVRSIRRPPGVDAPSVVLLHIPTGADAQAAVDGIADSIPGTELVVLPELEMLDFRDADDRDVIHEARKRSALARVAAHRECTLLLGVSATRAAELVLASVVCARPEPAPGPELDEMCTTVEPLRDVRTRHLVRYARDVLDSVCFANPEVDSAIVRVVTRFVATAERDNTSAVHNVVRTAARLLDSEGVVCTMCGTKTQPTSNQSRDEDDDESTTGVNGGLCGMETLCIACKDIMNRSSKKDGTHHRVLVESIVALQDDVNG